MNVLDALPPQTAALVAAARRALWSDDARPFPGSADTHTEIDIDLARRHGMLAWTPNVSLDAQRAHVRQALGGIHRLLEAAGALDRARVPFVAFKGPILAQSLY